MYSDFNGIKKYLDTKVYKTIDISTKILSQISRASFRLYDNDEIVELLKKDGLKRTNKVIFEEMISKCQIASIATLHRNLNWLEAISISNKNFLSFMSSVRGFMENTGDIFYSYQHLAVTLSDHFKIVQNALDGNESRKIDTSAFDNHLDHFLFATRGMDKTHDNPVLKPERSATYIKELENGCDIQYYDLYGDLCQFVHPSSYSLAIYFQDGSNPGELVYFGKRKDEELINLYFEHYPELFIDMIMKAFNPVFLLLKTLGFFNTSVLQTPNLKDINLDSIKAWRDIEEKMRVLIRNSK